MEILVMTIAAKAALPVVAVMTYAAALASAVFMFRDRGKRG